MRLLERERSAEGVSGFVEAAEAVEGYAEVVVRLPSAQRIAKLSMSHGRLLVGRNRFLQATMLLVQPSKPIQRACLPGPIATRGPECQRSPISMLRSIEVASLGVDPTDLVPDGRHRARLPELL